MAEYWLENRDKNLDQAKDPLVEQLEALKTKLEWGKTRENFTEQVKHTPAVSRAEQLKLDQLRAAMLGSGGDQQTDNFTLKTWGVERNPKAPLSYASDTVGRDGARISGQQLFDRRGNSIGANWWGNGLDFKKTYTQTGADTLKDRAGNVQSQGANIDIGNWYKINVVEVQKWMYKLEWQTVKDSRWNTLPISKDDFQNLTKNIRRI